MMYQRCETCRYWQERLSGALAGEIGRCRRYAPRPHVPPDELEATVVYAWAVWPTTKAEDVCGEWQERSDDAST